jgi:hypothetical protein
MVSGRTPTNAIGFNINDLLQIVSDATTNAQTKIDAINNEGQNISIGDMFDMQMFMNKLAQLSEMCTSVVNASHTAISSMARNVKG